MKNFNFNMLLVLIGKQKPLYRWGAIGVIMVGMVVAYFVTSFLPHQARMEEMAEQFSQKKAEFSKMVVLVRDRGQYMEEVEHLDRELKYAITVLPDKKEIPSLLKKISEEAEKFGLEVYYFEPQSESVQGFIAAVPVAIKLKGSFHEVLSFFDSVNKFARIVNISDIQMKADPQSEQKAAQTREKVKKSVSSADAFTAFQPNKTELEVSFRATTYRFLSQNEMGGGGGK
ncbi:MAG TPA: type 4a pilus biogenesis protein PilO [bacterium]|nr:type 4a pilus biogenesis protein PilO [bacterium]